MLHSSVAGPPANRSAPKCKSSRKLSRAQEQQIVEAYLAFESAREIGRRFGVSGPTCLDAVRRAGVAVRGASEAGRGYHLNENYFEIIDSDAKAYWLGFIAADGTVFGRTLAVALTISDEPHLCKLASALNAQVKMRHSKSTRPGAYSGKPISLFSVKSVKIVTDLGTLGIVPRKSRCLKPWAGPESLLPAYWRGVLDGDGSWYLCKTWNQWKLSLIGTKEIVTAFAGFVSQCSARKSPTPVQNRGFWYVRVGSILQLQSVATALYRDATVFLNRKKILVDQMLQVQRQRQDWSWVTPDHMMNLYQELGSWEAVGRALGMGRSPGNARSLRHRLGLL